MSYRNGNNTSYRNGNNTSCRNGNNTSYRNQWCLSLTYFIPQLFFYKYIQTHTIYALTYKQKGKWVEPQVLKLIYGS